MSSNGFNVPVCVCDTLVWDRSCTAVIGALGRSSFHFINSLAVGQTHSVVSRQHEKSVTLIYCPGTRFRVHTSSWCRFEFLPCCCSTSRWCFSVLLFAMAAAWTWTNSSDMFLRVQLLHVHPVDFLRDRKSVGFLVGSDCASSGSRREQLSRCLTTEINGWRKKKSLCGAECQFSRLLLQLQSEGIPPSAHWLGFSRPAPGVFPFPSHISHSCESRETGLNLNLEAFFKVNNEFPDKTRTS